MAKKIVLGRKYKHIIHDLTCIATDFFRYTNGRILIGVEYMKDEEVKSCYFPPEMLTLVKAQPGEEFPTAAEPVNKKFKLGKVYREKVHGIEGLAICIVSHLTGCSRICLQYFKKGDLKETYFDINMLEDVKVKPTTTGGPGKEAPSMNA